VIIFNGFVCDGPCEFAPITIARSLLSFVAPEIGLSGPAVRFAVEAAGVFNVPVAVMLVRACARSLSMFGT
jgi:hypothetical protein